MIKLSNITKVFQQGSRTITALSGVTLHVPAGQIYGVIGSSGAGKSTLIRCANMLERPTSGQVLVDGQDLTSLSESELTRARRQIGMIFQHFNLLSSRTVFGNVALPLELDNTPRAEIKKRVTELLELVGLADKHDAYPANLSGGQKQRVALARALAVEPQILLLDEPFGALDAQVRKELRRWLRQLHEELKFTSVFVTHDQEEAMEVADRIVVMSQGNIEQVGSPEEIMREPASRFVLEFMGEVNRLNGEIRGSQLFVGAHQWPLSFQPMHQGSVDLFLRPWEMEVATESSERCPLPVQVLEVSPRGHFWQLTVQPIGWHQEPIGVVLPEGNPTPVRGGRYYVGSLNARLYAGDQLLQPVALAKSA
ncbi:sulfate/thiosulfate ABC transporter ATP-binding protein CysA [Serratia marcescens]|uniref:sulfate/thiosulfate ABC transporter ATP-binding protein CysA n=1 Tax=Serratia marcescens TaxID=615 RepID=UPI000F7F990F|nr:sulfate/thiosulfate ABC transporter ATP-binding protein CysA [Serratia marcescens]RTF15668.1 sulfate/thiosulfate ABC transporter ATP-binding protein CysA [Serratia marcescens]